MQYYKIPFLFLLLALHAGCAPGSAEDLSAQRALTSAMEASNRTIQSQTRYIYDAIGQRLSEPSSKFQAEIWSPKTEKVRKVSQEAFDFLEAMKKDLKEVTGIGPGWKGDSAINLSDRSADNFFSSGEKEKGMISVIKKYEANMLNIDTEMTKTFEQTFRYTSIDAKGVGLASVSFKHISVGKALLLLDLIQNNVRINENMFLMYCLSKIPYIAYSGRQIFI